MEISLEMPVIVFFDLGDTLVVPKLSQAGALRELTPLPLVPDVLKKLKGLARTAGKSIKLGVISNTGSETRDRMHSLLTSAKLLEQFDPALLLFSSVENLDKTKKAFFQLAAKRAGVPAQQCIYVGEDKVERDVAAKAGFRTSYHPLHALYVAGQMMQGE